MRRAPWTEQILDAVQSSVQGSGDLDLASPRIDVNVDSSGPPEHGLTRHKKKGESRKVATQYFSEIDDDIHV